MRWGLICRSETDRGLGIQTYEMYRNLQPDKTLVVLSDISGFRQHPELYPDASFVNLENTPQAIWLDEATVRDWWSGLDVVVTVETFYDWRIIEWAKADGVTTIVHGNPEFYQAELPQPDVWWFPTTWRLDKLPSGPVIPVPVSPDAQPCALDPSGSVLDLLYIGGNKAMADRNGSQIVVESARMFNRVRVTSYCQAGRVGPARPNWRELPSPENRFDMYKNKHALVIPRRYGGLCLPAQEAMACGLAVIMTDTSPNLDWPIIPVESIPSRHIHLAAGTIETVDVYPSSLVNVWRGLDARRDWLKRAQTDGLRWAERNSWDILKDTYYDAIEVARG